MIMPIESLFFMILLYAYIPLQIAFLGLGVWLIKTWDKTWWKLILGIVLLMFFTLMLPFTRLVGSLVYLMLTGQEFSN